MKVFGYGYLFLRFPKTKLFVTHVNGAWFIVAYFRMITTRLIPTFQIDHCIQLWNISGTPAELITWGGDEGVAALALHSAAPAAPVLGGHVPVTDALHTHCLGLAGGQAGVG